MCFKLILFIRMLLNLRTKASEHQTIRLNIDRIKYNLGLDRLRIFRIDVIQKILENARECKQNINVFLKVSKECQKHFRNKSLAYSTCLCLRIVSASLSFYHPRNKQLLNIRRQRALFNVITAMAGNVQTCLFSRSLSIGKQSQVGVLRVY